ncbi:hypothetical protein BDZ45DRAFT_681047 [Acephala macrosclerotiorum]|nr:hypothetical protein BDZ45DRAFT_681047 [Acephala macrosclerotiorum]
MLDAASSRRSSPALMTTHRVLSYFRSIICISASTTFSARSVLPSRPSSDKGT